MNSVFLTNDKVLISGKWGSFNDALVLGYFTGTNFLPADISIASGVTFQTSFAFPSDLVSTNLIDTSATASFQKFDKPYAVSGRVVVITFKDSADFVDSFNSDLGDYITITCSSPATPSGTNRTVSVLGVINSTLTDAYTPLSSIIALGSRVHISYYDLDEILSLSPAPIDPFIQSIVSGNTPMPNLPTSAGMSVGAPMSLGGVLPSTSINRPISHSPNDFRGFM